MGWGGVGWVGVFGGLWLAGLEGLPPTPDSTKPCSDHRPLFHSSVCLGQNGSSLSVSWLANEFPMRISPVLPVVRLDRLRLRHLGGVSPFSAARVPASPMAPSQDVTPLAMERLVLAKLGVVTECTVKKGGAGS